MLAGAFMLKFFFLLQGIITLIFSKCIGVDRASSAFCSFCSSGFYRSQIYQNLLEKDAGYFPINKCLSQSDQLLDIEIFISNKACSVGPCTGTLENPFETIVSG